MDQSVVNFSWERKHTLIAIACVVFLLFLFGWLWPLLKLFLWLSLGTALISAIAMGVHWRNLIGAQAPFEELQTAQNFFIGSSILTLSLAAVVWSMPQSTTSVPQPIALTNTQTAMPKNGSSLDSSSLALASATLFGTWEESDAFFNDSSSWSGTAFVVSKSLGRLILYTNSHCLNLSGLRQSDDDGSIEVLRYELVIKFPSGAVKAVRRVAEETTNLDLARLEVDCDSLTEGKDYIIVPDGSNLSLSVGDRVVAVGSPLGEYLSGTHTFGNVSAIRDISPSGVKCKTIQHDAAINHGNSGGPLFLERDGRMYWVGINTWGYDNAQGIFFSIAAQESQVANFAWADATPSGAATLLQQLYGVSATATNP